MTGRVKNLSSGKVCKREAGKECEKRKLQMFLKTQEFFPSYFSTWQSEAEVTFVVAKNNMRLTSSSSSSLSTILSVELTGAGGCHT